MTTTNPTQSPEETGIYQCPACPNKALFTGIDVRGYGGPSECVCGAETVENPQRAEDSECTCHTELRQDFRIKSVCPDDGDVDIEYEAFTGGGIGADITGHPYTSILCRECGATVWSESEVAA